MAKKNAAGRKPFCRSGARRFCPSCVIGSGIRGETRPRLLGAEPHHLHAQRQRTSCLVSPDGEIRRHPAPDRSRVGGGTRSIDGAGGQQRAFGYRRSGASEPARQESGNHSDASRFRPHFHADSAPTDSAYTRRNRSERRAKDSAYTRRNRVDSAYTRRNRSEQRAKDSAYTRRNRVSAQYGTRAPACASIDRHY